MTPIIKVYQRNLSYLNEYLNNEFTQESEYSSFPYLIQDRLKILYSIGKISQPRMYVDMELHDTYQKNS